MERWDALMVELARHLISRYGIDEVAQWYFEVWNEPNIDFWNGIPRQKSYFELYEHTARALKSVSSRLRVGGPATAAASWVDSFLKYMAERKAPVDFASTHGYADDTVEDLFGTQEDIPMDDRVCRAVAKVRGQIRASATPNLPLLWTEWNVPGKDRARDTPYVGPAVANTIRECDGMVDALSFWTFSDVFEEGGPIPEPFIGQFGLRAKGGINKPSFYDFALLHKLGGERIANSNESVLVTRRKEGTLAIALWNLVDPGQKGATRKIRLSFQNLPSDTPITMSSVDNEHGNVLAAYRAMGSPRYPTEEQIQHMNAATKLPPPRVLRLTGSYLDVELVPNELALLELAPGRTAAQ
jgi:xylan 1,4-beta-xylosidase